jgi:hypothetical protein
MFAIVAKMQQTLPELARVIREKSGDEMATLARSAASSVRQHRAEMLILAATAAFVVLVALLGLAVLV